MTHFEPKTKDHVKAIERPVQKNKVIGIHFKPNDPRDSELWTQFEILRRNCELSRGELAKQMIEHCLKSR